MTSLAYDDVVLEGFGRTMPSRAKVVRPGTVDQMSAVVAAAGPRGVLARGAGRSYGDAAQNGGGVVVDLGAFADVEVHDDGSVVAGAGATLAAIIPLLLERARFLPVTPGTRWITVGGAIAADVHGKNHHVDGSFGDHVRWIDLLTADGVVRRLTHDAGSAEDRELFDATIGGMGLTGVLLAASFSTIPSPTASVVVDTHRLDDLDALMRLMVESDAGHRYSVAWLDGTARGSKLGRGVLTLGDHAETTSRGGGRRGSGPSAAPGPNVPPVPFSPLNRLSLAAFNEAYYRRAPRRRIGEVMGLEPYFYPLDVVSGWNRLYGARGFVQYQVAVPDAGADVVRRILERLAAIGAPSFLTVLKRFGDGRIQSPLSFPISGWTLAIDVPARVPGLASTLDQLDDQVLAVGGRHYLAKDSRALPEAIAAGYPRLGEFRAVKQRVDPAGVFASDLSRRLQL